MIAALLGLAAFVQAAPAQRPDFATMSDLQIDEWLRGAHFYHAENVYVCQGLTQRAAEGRLRLALRSDFRRRHERISAALQARHGSAYEASSTFIAIGHGITAAYCRRIRNVVTDMLRATGVLEQRLGLTR